MARIRSDSLFEALPRLPDFTLEEAAMRDGFMTVAGMDEAGRGPLAGPVVAATVILDPSAIPEGLNDSKKLSARQRDALFDRILETAAVAIASVPARSIDLSDIRKASLEAMRRAVAALPEAPHFGLVDGRDVPPGLLCPARAVVKGDSRSVSIAAASIVAKVMRDRMMERADEVWPAYGFASHRGYGAKAHLAAIAAHGPCPIHRMSFRPLRKD